VQANDNKQATHRNEYRHLLTPLSYVINTFNSMTEQNVIDGNHTEIPFYSPLVNDKTKECFWSEDPSVYFAIDDEFSMRSFYDTVMQDRLLKHIKKKADGMHHKKLG
jgi:hypothetical protein